MTANWKRYLSFFEGSYGRAALGAALAFGTGLALVPVPLLVGYAFDQAIPSGRNDLLLGIGAALVSLQALSSGCTLLTRKVVLDVTKTVTANLRVRAIARLLEAPRSYYTQRDASSLHDLVVPETDRIDSMGGAILGQVMPAIVLGSGICLVLIALNWQLFLVMLAVLPVNVIAARRIGDLLRSHVGRFHESHERFSQGVLFLVRAFDLTRIQTAEKYETERLRGRIDQLKESSGNVIWSGALYSVSQQALIAVSGVVVLVVGGTMVSAGTMTIGALLSFFAGLMLLRNPLHNLMTGMPRLMEGAESLRHFLAFLDSGELEPYQGTRRIAFTGAVSLRDVSFSYTETPVLSSTTLDLVPGEVVAIVGRNGSGKSTIVNLILGFYRPGRGAVLADGVPYEELDVRALRRSIAVVTQDPILVPGTIRENLTYGHADATHDDVTRISQIVGVDRFAEPFPDKYDTEVGDDGKRLSGGQKQRLSLGRALLSRPRLLILDEPMNHLDEADGAAFLHRLISAAGQPAILLISHRDDVSIADRVYRLDEGRLSLVTDSSGPSRTSTLTSVGR